MSGGADLGENCGEDGVRKGPAERDQEYKSRIFSTWIFSTWTLTTKLGIKSNVKGAGASLNSVVDGQTI